MHKPELINVLQDPAILQVGDIIGFNQLPGHSKTQVAGSSGMPAEKFRATAQQPGFRGFVLSVTYKGDTPGSVIIMPMAPVLKDQPIPNDDKNRTISNTRQLQSMGLSPEVNWRLNFMPVALDITPKNFALPEDGKMVRFGRAKDGMRESILEQVERLLHKRILHSANFLPPSTARELQGREIACYHHVIGQESGVAVYGNQEDTNGAAAAEARAARERRENNKEKKADAARALKMEMTATPSGRVAHANKLRFKGEEQPDISLDDAFEFDLFDEDTFLILDDMGYKTLRTTFDAFHNDRAGFLKKLEGTGTSKGDREQFKESVAVDLKSALKNFYSQFQRERNPLEQYIIPYRPGPVDPLAEKPDAQEAANPRTVTLAEAFERGVISHATREFLKDAKVPDTDKAPEDLGDAYRIVTEAPGSLSSIFGLQSPKSKIRARIIEEVTQAIEGPKPA